MLALSHVITAPTRRLLAPTLAHTAPLAPPAYPNKKACMERHQRLLCLQDRRRSRAVLRFLLAFPALYKMAPVPKIFCRRSRFSAVQGCSVELLQEPEQGARRALSPLPLPRKHDPLPLSLSWKQSPQSLSLPRETTLREQISVH